jgi:nucleoside-diphosphate-sugar epimerase
VRQPCLGLDASAVAALKDAVREIVHCAAETRFDRTLEEARAANVAGTANLLALARHCPRLEKFAYISTVYAAGRASGRIPEAPLDGVNGFSNTYQQSKHEAEKLVVDAMGEAPAAIFRLSSIIGDSRSGRVRQFNYVHQILKLFPRNALPVAPGDPEAPVDLIPTDWAADSLAYLFDSGFAAGRVYHVCAGAERSLTVREMLELTRELFEAHPKARRWLPIRVPELAPLAEYEAFVERSRQSDDRLLKEVLRVLGYFLPHLGIHQAFENRLATAALAASGLEFPPVREFYPRVVNYCLESDWGRL